MPSLEPIVDNCQYGIPLWGRSSERCVSVVNEELLARTIDFRFPLKPWQSMLQYRCRTSQGMKQGNVLDKLLSVLEFVSIRERMQ